MNYLTDKYGGDLDEPEKKRKKLFPFEKLNCCTMSCDMNKIIINFYVYEINIRSLKSSPETNVDIQQIEIIIGYHGDELEKFLDKLEICCKYFL